MKKRVIFACVAALAAAVLPASAESGGNSDGGKRARDFVAQGTPPGDYRLEHDRDDHKKPPHPCKGRDHHNDHDDDDCGHPASR